MKVSIIVPAHNEEKNIGHCINSLISQTKKPDEIIIINDASTDHTRRIITNFQKKNKNIKIINRKKSAGYTQAALSGLKIVKGDIIAIFDADSTAPKHWIKTFYEQFKNQSVGIVTGPWFPKNDRKLLPKIIKARKIIFNKIKSNKNFKKIFKGDIFGAGTNLAYRRDFAEKTNLLKKAPDFAIDTYIQKRIIHAGYKSIYLPKNIVYSNAPEKITQLTKQSFRYGKGKAAIFRFKVTFLIKNLIIVLSPILLILAMAYMPYKGLIFLLILSLFMIAFSTVESKVFLLPVSLIILVNLYHLYDTYINAFGSIYYIIKKWLTKNMSGNKIINNQTK